MHVSDDWPGPGAGVVAIAASMVELLERLRSGEQVFPPRKPGASRIIMGGPLCQGFSGAKP